MTFREIAREAMVARGMSPEEVARGMQAASMAMPGANVDRAVPPEEESALRKRMADLIDAAVQHPLVVKSILHEHVQRTAVNN